MDIWKLLFRRKDKEQDVVVELHVIGSQCSEAVAKPDLFNRQYELEVVVTDYAQCVISADGVCIGCLGKPTHISDKTLDLTSFRYCLNVGVIYSLVFRESSCINAKNEIVEGENTDCINFCVSSSSILIGSEEWINKWK